ncbi:putative aldehyde dehydrogenase [Trypanosoma conorhini]|uniref:Putative aldehyde dehydrogenase n=1 Tax=Trypanosoma conorhini TaxID=83891 RepID=A0A422Q9R2_9TRYP|nr:putative aldehyde dehydrogenase [Trypanosoma conorhini]RNF26677.1 putative aldehyde dehydrogenase [Trypanosoma conorhini]
MRRTPCVFCKAVFDLNNAARFATGVVLDRPVAFLNGKFVTPAAGATIAVEDPCTQTFIGEVPNLGRDDTMQAIGAAKSAFEGWKKVMPRERAVIIHRWAQLMLHHSESLGAILSRESGKALAEAVGECLYAERYLEWYAGEAERVYGDIVGGPREGVTTTILRRPLGVVGVITPWNFPSSMVTRAVGGALAAGCTVVLKPSEYTPFSALVLAQLAAVAGVPPGVFNVLTGDAEPIGDTLLDSFEVRKIAFTGSTRTGKHLYARSAATMKRLGLELGGNAPFIVFDDADLNRAVSGLITSKFRNAGQACISSNRVFVHESMHDAFVARLVEKIRATVRVGNSFDANATMGSLIHGAAVDRVEALVHDAVAKGAKVELGGTRLPGPGYFFEPTVITCVQHDTMNCCQQEVFGPIVPIIKFSSESEVVQLANATRSGLAAYIYTQDYRRQSRVAEQLQFGMLGVNDVGLSSPSAPFGGVKEGGLGRDGSKYGIDAFVDIKYVLESRV